MKNFLEKVQKKVPAGKKRSDRNGKRTRQKNNRGDSKVESNDSPGIPDRGETSDIPGLPSGELPGKQWHSTTATHNEPPVGQWPPTTPKHTDPSRELVS